MRAILAPVLLTLMLGWSAPSRAEWLFATQVILSAVAQNELWRFDSATPGAAVQLPITGTVNAMDTISALDFRPSTGELYGLGVYDDSSVSGNHVLRLYRINPLTGMATVVDTTGVSIPANLAAYAMSFEGGNQIRIVRTDQSNLRLNPDTGQIIATDTNLAFAGGDPTPGSPFVSAIAQDAGGTLWGIDSGTGHDVLVRIGGVAGSPSPDGGETNTIGALGVNPSSDFLTGFDISPTSATAYAFANSGSDTLYTVNLATGAMTSLGVIGSGSGALEGFAVAPASFAVPATQASIPTLSFAGLAGLFALLAAAGMWLARRPGPEH